MTPTAPSDPELLANWLNHQSEAAFRELVARYAGLVQMTARRTCADDSMAAEAAQLTFITLARKAKSLTSCTSLGGWLHLTAMMQAKTLLRNNLRENRKRQLLQAAMETDIRHHSGDLWQEMQPVLDDALAALSARDREALLLRFYRSLSVREIAATLGIATDAAQKRIDRATDRLRGKLLRRGCQAGGSLSAVLLAGFAADAQAAVPAVSLLASKAIAAASVHAGVFSTASLITVAMKTTTIAPPLIALMIGVAWIATQRHSIATLESQTSLLQSHLAADTGAVAAVVKSTAPGKLPIPQGPINWEDVARQLIDMRQNDLRGYQQAWGGWQQRLSSMNEEELTAALDEIESPDFPAESRELLEGLLIDPLIDKIPRVALTRFSDRLGGEPKGITWGLPRALEAWARVDPEAAALWLDQQDAAGAFEHKALSDRNPVLMKFEGFLIAGLISTDPAAAARRLAAIPDDQLKETLSPFKFGTIKEEDQLAYANLVRGSRFPAGDKTSLLAWQIENLPAHDDYSAASDYLTRIHAAPDERAVCVERAVQTRITQLTEARKITRQDLDRLREWTDSQAPELTARVTGSALGIAFRGRNPIGFSEAAALAAAYQNAGGYDDILIQLLNCWDGPDSTGEARALADKISDENRRQTILERLKVWEMRR